MKKIRVLGICFVLLAVIAFHPIPVMAVESETVDLDMNSQSAVLMEPETGQILYEKDAHKALRPASVTKIMTILLTMEAIRDGKAALDDPVTVSANAAGYGGSTIFLEEGETIALENLIKGMCIASGNDAAIAAAEYIGGSQDGFVDMMNQRAKELGMLDTHFVNPCGLDADGHVTSAYDIAVMSRELVNTFPQVLEYTSIWHEMMPHQWKKGAGETDMANTNKLIQSYEGMKGLKTGFTRLARYSLSAVAERENLTLIAVIMGAETKEIRSEEICRLLDYGFGTYEMQKIPTDGCIMGEIPVINGSGNRVQGVLAGDISYLIRKGEKVDASQLDTEIQWNPDLCAPIRKGEKVGVVKYRKEGVVIAEKEVLSTADIKEAKWADRLRQLLQLWS